MTSGLLYSSTGSTLCGATSRPGLALADFPSIRHCPKCQGTAAKAWLADREAELPPVPYYRPVFTLPASIAEIAYQNKAAIYDILFKASAETLITIAAERMRADPE